MSFPGGTSVRTDEVVSPLALGMRGHTMRKLVLMMGVSLDGLVARPATFGAGG